MLSEYSLKPRSGCCAQSLYILFFFFAIAPQGKKLWVLYLDYFLKVKTPPASWGYFCKRKQVLFFLIF
jgi:hypothetical protein